MKINEVERQVGITKRNIRFYEKEGLLAPGRNSENGYRDYSDADVETLKQIKLFRKLDLPMEEIRRLQRGTLNVEDAMSRHIIQLERERTNLAGMAALCQELADDRPMLDSMETDRYLRHMEEREQEGTRFMNVKKQDTRIKYIAPVVITLGMIVLMAGFVALILWGVSVDAEDAPPLGLLLFLIAIPVVISFGVLAALFQRIKQIRGGEEDAASKY